MAPTDRFVPRFAAEPPQEGAPYGRWAHRLSDAFYRACDEVDADGEDLGEPGEITFYPDRTYAGRTYVPATAPTSTGLELFGHVSFAPAAEGSEPSDIAATADFTAETAERNPDWSLDLSDDVIGTWRGEEGRVAQVTLVYGRPLRAAGAIVTAELADLAVDQCTLVEDRFTLIAPDDYRADTLEVKLFDTRGREVASESLYEDDGEDEEPD
ncbi:MAG: hypothetical protein QOH11_2232 [Solirubrobacteraceae bacterium]|jgi:hypothetical protein|nr:hypothetical protein [Solirubrobacteraceae bacterium]